MPPHQPAGYPTVSVYMMVNNAQNVIDFAIDTLGGELILRMEREDGSLMHGSLRIGDSVVMLADATKDSPAFPVWLHVYVSDVDATYRRALEKGARSVREPADQGDGDRRGGVEDSAGNTWWIATYVDH